MSKPLYNIAHILPWPSVGGTEHATLRIAQAAAVHGYASVAFCTEDAAPVRALFAAAGFNTATYTAAQLSYRHPQNFLRASRQLARELKNRRIDLVHCADLLAAYYASFAGKLAGVPVLCHIRNRFDDISAREKPLLRLVNRFAFVSRDTWRHFGYKVSKRRGVTIYDGIDVSRDACDEVARRQIAQQVRAEFKIPGDAKIIGMVARVAPQKDYRTLIKAAARIIKTYPRALFLIVGDYEQTPAHREHYREVRQLLDTNNVAPFFVFTGLRADVARLMCAMDVFTLSTHWEGLPLVILEAMAQGAPVVATAVDGIPEIIQDNENGLLYPHADDAQLATHLLALLKDEARAARLGEAGRRAVETSWNRAQFAAGMSNLYECMLGNECRAAEGRVVGNSSHEFEGKSF